MDDEGEPKNPVKVLDSKSEKKNPATSTDTEVEMKNSSEGMDREPEKANLAKVVDNEPQKKNPTKGGDNEQEKKTLLSVREQQSSPLGISSGATSTTSGPDSSPEDSPAHCFPNEREEGIFEQRDDGIVTYVTEDLTRKIRASHGITSRSRSLSSSSLSSGGWTSSYGPSAADLSRSSSYPMHLSDDVPPIDPHTLKDLETHAKRVADNLQQMMSLLKTNLHKMSSLTVQCTNVYAASVDKTCDVVDSSIKGMYALMAKCEEMSNEMAPVRAMQEDIDKIKRVLDKLEAVILKDGGKT